MTKLANPKHILWCFVCERNFDGHTGKVIDLREYQSLANKIITSGMCPECQEIDDRRAERIVPALIGVDEEMYVIVNKASSQITSGPATGEYYICATDNGAVTYGDLQTAASALVDLIEEYEHTLETAVVYRLVPVDKGRIVIELAKAANKAVQEDKGE